MVRMLVAGLAFTALVLGAGCAVTGPSGTGGAPVFSPGVYLAPPSPRPLGRDQLAKRLGRARVVLAGETHNHPGHHRIQLEILKKMSAAGPPPVVAVEWLEQGDQPACDRFSAGDISLEQFAAQVDWKRKWGYPLKLYAPILKWVQKNKLKLIAANAPAKLVRQTARQGLASLSAAQRSELADSLNLDDPAYQKMLADEFRVHGRMAPRRLKDFVAAQIVRDETMAQNLARALRPWPDGGKRALLLVGGGHLAHGQGLPPRIRRRLPGVELLTILPVSPEAAETALREPGPPPADILAVSTPAPPRRPRLGILAAPSARGLKVEMVIPGGPAAKAGLEPGDVLTKLDGRPLTKVKDIHNAVRAAPFKAHKYRVLRGEKNLEFIITLEK